MKKFLSILFLLMMSQIVFAQEQNEAYKFGEYNNNGGGGCEEYIRVADFAGEISKQDGSTGLIVIYNGANKERLGNILAYVSGAKEFFTRWLKLPENKINFIIADGKNWFAEEFWIIPKNAPPPNIVLAGFDWSSLQTKYHFSSACLTCEPSYSTLTNFQPAFEEYAELLKKYSHYKGIIVVRNFGDLITIRDKLVDEYNLPRNRFQILLEKRKSVEESMGSELYITPKK